MENQLALNGPLELLELPVASGPECFEEHGLLSQETLGSKIWVTGSDFLPPLNVKPKAAFLAQGV